MEPAEFVSLQLLHKANHSRRKMRRLCRSSHPMSFKYLCEPMYLQIVFKLEPQLTRQIRTGLLRLIGREGWPLGLLLLLSKTLPDDQCLISEEWTLRPREGSLLKVTCSPQNPRSLGSRQTSLLWCGVWRAHLPPEASESCQGCQATSVLPRAPHQPPCSCPHSKPVQRRLLGWQVRTKGLGPL